MYLAFIIPKVKNKIYKDYFITKIGVRCMILPRAPNNRMI
jgi:hypothetical protein